jgi:hypothetical protein
MGMTNIERYRRRVLVADLAKQGTAPLDIAKRMGASVDFVMKIIGHGPDWQDHARTFCDSRVGHTPAALPICLDVTAPGADLAPIWILESKISQRERICPYAALPQHL